MITVTAFKWVPDFARGQVRDLRVRWALEEAGLPYKSKLIDQEEKATPAYRALQPFGQVPAYIEDDLVLFETGAILLHVGEKSETLLPREPKARARAVSWVFCALNSMEPSIQELGGLSAFYANEEWAKQRRPGCEAQVRKRLADLAAALGDKDYLEGRFTAGDLMMSTVFRILSGSGLLEEQPRLAALKARCEARPAFKRALEAQLADFEER
jgi:glutathione S-transferase